MRRLLLILAFCLFAAGTARSQNLGILVKGETLGISACSGGHHVAEGAPMGYPLYTWDIGVQIEPLRK